MIDRNTELINSPEMIADDPYGEGWMLKVRVDNPDDELESTLSAEEYRAYVVGEET